MIGADGASITLPLCDLVNTDDNNGDGVVDAGDIEVEEGAERPQPDENGCYSTVGPLDGVVDTLALPTDDFSAVVAGGYPLAFTNPFLVDGDGSGAFEGVAP